MGIDRKEMMPTLLSIDYDFLVPHGMYEKSVYLPACDTEIPGYFAFDWQMGENRHPTLDYGIWQTRCMNFKRWGLDIQEMTKPKLSPEDFILAVSSMCNDACVPAWHADSHAWAAVCARDFSEQFGPLNVVNFDAHHDLGYSDDYKIIGDEVSCDNWALAGLQQNHIVSYTLVYPDWLGTVEMPKARRKLLKPVEDRIEITTFSEWLRGDEIDELQAAFFCRSSSWVPPWLDSGFQTLLDAWGYVECLDCRYGQMCSPHNSCKPREWDWADVEREMADREERFAALVEFQKGS